MKKLISVIFLGLFLTNLSYSQSSEALTNSTIIKMVKAKLSDDLIIDEINASKVNFNFSPESIKILSGENVSLPVIQAMKNANGRQSPSLESTPETAIQPVVSEPKDTVVPPVPPENTPVVKEKAIPPQTVQAADTLSSPAEEKLKTQTSPLKELPKEKTKTERVNDDRAEKPSVKAEAVGYVIPLEDLMTFYDKEFNSLTGTIRSWDIRVRNFIEDGNQIKEKINRIEKELTVKKNADSKGFSKEIIELKKQLAEKRESYKLFENNMVADGLKISKELSDLGNKLDGSIDYKYSAVSQAVRKSELNPSIIGDPKAIAINKQLVPDNIVDHVLPATGMLFFFQNQIVSMRELIIQWNIKVTEINQKDLVLSRQMEPLAKELLKYQAKPKENKKEIADLKKQISVIDRDKKTLARQMEADSKELSEYIDQACKEAQGFVEQRLNDIIENIRYSYQDNFTYRDI